MEKREFDVFELIRILLQNRWFIIIFVAVVSIAAVTYSLVTPKIWESRATFYVVGDDIGSSLGLDIPGLSGITSQLMGSDSSQNAVNAISALSSRLFTEDVIRKFDLFKYFEIAEKDSLLEMDIALKKIRGGMISFGLDSDSGLVTISVETEDKKLSSDMVEYYLKKLERYNREQKLTKGKMNREFLESRVLETRALIDSLIISVRDFQQRNNTIDLESQTSALIGSYSEVIASKMQGDIELELARKNYDANSPVISELKTRNDALARQIRELEIGGGTLKPRYLINISSLPDIGSQYAQLKLNLEIQAKVYEFLYPQFEAARLEELRDVPSLDILDTPREAGLRLRPKRAVICVIAFMLAFITAVLIVLIKHFLSGFKGRIQEIRKSL